MGDSQSCILKLTFPRNALACETVPESIVGRYSIFSGNLLYYKINDFLGLQRKFGSIITSKNSQTMLKRCYLYACFIGGALMLFFGSVSTDNFNISFTASISAVLYCFFVLWA